MCLYHHGLLALQHQLIRTDLKGYGAKGFKRSTPLNDAIQHTSGRLGTPHPSKLGCSTLDETGQTAPTPS